MEEVVELLVGVESFWDEHCSLICVEAGEDRDFVPLSCSPGLDGSHWDHPAFAVNYGFWGVGESAFPVLACL